MSFPKVNFLEVVKDATSGNIKTKTRDYLKVGKYAIVDQGLDLIGGYSNDRNNLCAAELPVIIFGDHTKHLKFIDFPFCLGADGTKVLTPKTGNIDKKYLYYYLRSIQLEDAGYSRHYKFLKEVKIPLPPILEQKRIVAILDQADTLRQKRQQALDNLNQLGQSIFYEMFGDMRHNAAFDPLGDKIDFVSSLVKPTLPEYEFMPHVGPEHIEKHSGIINWPNVRTAKEDGVISGKYIFNPDDVIYSKIRPYLNKVAVADRTGLCSADMYALKPKLGETSSRFIKYLLMGRDFLDYAKTCSGRANIPKLNRKQLSAYSISFPDAELQKKFSQQVIKIEEEAKFHMDSFTETMNLFNSLQQRAFKGKL